MVQEYLAGWSARARPNRIAIDQGKEGGYSENRVPLVVVGGLVVMVGEVMGVQGVGMVGRCSRRIRT